MSRSRSVRLIARLLIFALYMNGLGPLLVAPAEAAAHAAVESPDGGGSGALVSLFGPKRYTRTGGLFNLFNDSISVPDWMRPPYVVHIKNGESDGSHRVTGALIFLSGLPVATPLDFNQNTNTVDRPVLLLPLLVSLLGLSVQVYGPTGSYVTITVSGTSGDTQAPSLTITAPPANTTTNDNTPDLALTYADSATSTCNASGIDTTSLRVTLDGVDRTNLFTATSTGAQATIPANLALSDGVHALHAEIRDRAGNLATADRTFAVHTVTDPPTLTITAPANGALVNTGTVAVSGTVVSHGNGAIGMQCRVGENTAPATITSGTWSCQVPLTEGENAILVSATDAAGTTQASRQVVRDATAPALAITAPGDGTYTTASSVAVSGSVSDVHATTVTVNGIAATVSGNEFQVANVPVGSGPDSTITATAVDAAGNPSTTQITLHVPQSPLTVHITSPADGTIVHGPTVNVQGTTNHDLPVNVDVNGVQATVGTDGAFTAAGVPVAGTQTLHATAHDAAGRTATAAATVRVDTVAPTLTIDQPATGLVTNAQTVHVAGSVNDTSPMTVTVNDQPVSIVNGQYGTDVPLGATDASKTITVVATDSVGNATTSTVTVIVDRTAPTLLIASPANGALLSALPIVVQGTSTDANAASVTVDGVAATRTVDAWQIAVATLPDGPHTFNVIATDAAGNSTTKTVAVTVDTAAPVLTITTPTTGTLTRLDVINVEGTLQDTSAVTVTVNGLSATVTNGTFAVSGVPLAPDSDTTIVATATDATNRVSQASVVVTRDSTAPTLSIATPTDGSYTAAANVTVSGPVSDAHAVTVTVNGIAASVAGGQFEVANVPVGSGPTAAIVATATDAAGNERTAQVTLHVAQTPLTIQITSPADGATVRGPLVDVRGTTNQDLPVTVDVNGVQATVGSDGTFTAPQVPVLEGMQTLHATAHDAAGRTATADITVRVDTVAPTLTIDQPGTGLITNATTVHVAGSVSDTSPITLTVNDQPVSIANGQFATDVSLGAVDGAKTLTIVATDSVGNASTSTVTVIVDRTAPTLDVIAPTTGALVSALPIVVQGTVTDQNAATVAVDGTTATRTDDTWQVSFPTLPDGAHTFTVVATDAAGNVTTKSVPVTLDTAPPVLTLTAPESGTLTRLGTIDVAGTVQDTSAVTVIVNPGNLNAPVTNGTYAITGVPLATDGDVTITVSATDATHRTSTASVVVTRDSTPPTLDLTTPDRVTRRQTAQALATVSDTNGVAQVVFAVNGAAAGTFTASPFSIPLSVPQGLAIGDTFPVTATATDRAGNVSTLTRTVRIAADGAIVGQVLSDATGRPLDGATVHIGADTRTSDAQGRYTLPTEQASIALTVDQDGMTSVSRVVSMASGTGTVPVDARLTPLAAAVSIGANGGSLVALSTVGSGPTTIPPGTPAPTAPTATDPLIAIIVPAAAVAAATDVRLTPLTAQGLPDLMPLGWSPIAAFDLRSAATVSGPLTLRLTFSPAQATALGTSPALALVEYRPLLHAWVVVARDLAIADGGVLATTVPGTGAFALATPDTQDPPIVVPAVGDPLSGVAAIAIPETASSQGSVEPAVIPPTGGTARGELRVDSPAPLPSGTLVQAEITETFTLPTNQVASEEQRRADIVLYRAPARAIAANGGTTTPTPPDSVPPVSGTLPITPSRTFDPSSLLEGRVHLDILAGRESERGTPGGREAVTVSADDARLVVPAGALDNDTAIALKSAAFSQFLPVHATLTPLAELLVDLPGPALRSAAELSIAASTAAQAPGGSFVIARVDRVDGVPFLTVVSLAELSGDRLIARPAPGLPGITSSGRYLFYRVEGAIGFISGFTRAGGQPAASVLSTDSLPFIARSDATGRYTIAALASGANVTVTARVPRTSLVTSGAVPVTAGTVAALDLSLAATVTTAVVSPADGDRGVSRQPQITVTTSSPIAGTSVTPEAVHLWKVVDTTTTAVSVQALLAGSGQTLSIVPNARLDADTLYRLEVAGLTDIYGGAVSVPVSTFRTAVEAAPTYSPDALTFSFPDAAGAVTVSAPANSFPLGAQFLIINSVSGEVLSLGAGNDGSVNGKIRATLNDRLVITITDPDGHVTTLTRSQFIDQATGRTAIGPGGGTVEGPGGVALRIPEGAIAQAVTFKISAVGADQFPTQPEIPGAHFGGGLKIEASQTTRFAKEADLVFPLPADAIAATQAAGKQPKDAFFYVLNRGTSSDGQPVFETLDYAQVEGEGDNAKVVTASFPFSGLIDIGGLAAGYIIMMWTFDQALPGKPVGGVITGQVLQPVFENGAADPTYVGVPGVRVELVKPSDTPFDPHVGAITQKDGRYTIFEHRFISEPVQVRTTVDGETAHATVFTVQRTDTKLLSDPGLAALVQHGFFTQIGHANLTLSPAQPAPPAPALTIRTMRTVDGHRVDTRGLVVSGTPLIIGVDAGDAEVNNVSIAPVGAAERDEVPYAVQPDPARQQSPRDPLAMQFITAETFTPSQPGSYRVRATAVPAFGPAVSATITVRVLATGGGVDTDNNLPPAVITAQTVPKANAAGVPVSITPQIAFTEPVLHIPGNVHLRDASGADVSIKIGGVNVDANGQPIVIDDVTDAATVVTGLTIQPRFGLAFGMTYTLELTSGIIDRDTAPNGSPAPRDLVPFATTFTTFGPTPIGGTEAQFSSPGLVVLGDRAYVLETMFAGGVGGIQTGALRVFDVSDPVTPREIADPTDIGAAPRDIAGEDHTVAIATMSHTQFVNSDISSGPSNLLLYDVAGPKPVWTGAVSLTDNIQDGTPTRVVMKDQMAYVITQRKGLQVVDLSMAALGDLASAPAYEQYRRLYAPAQGVNRQAVVVTMPITDPARPNDSVTAWLNDIKVGDYRVDDVSQRLVIGTGYPAGLGLVVVNPVTQTIVSQSALQDSGAALASGQAIALAHIDNRDLAIVGGYGTIGITGAAGVVAIVDLSPLAANPHGTPTVIAWVALSHGVGDIVMLGNTAIVSGPSSNAQTETGVATLINLADPSHPLNAGTLTGVGSRMAEVGGILLSTNKTLLTSAQNPLGGVRTSALGEAALITKVDPEPIVVSAGDEVFTNVELSYRALPWDPTMTAGEVQINVRNGSNVATLPAPLNNATGSVVWPKGTIVNTLLSYEATLHVTQEGHEVRPVPRRLQFDKIPLALTTRDRLLRIQFALPTQGKFAEAKYGVKVYMTQPGTAMPTTPVFTLTSEQIKNAYPNEDVWWPGDRNSAEATADWVTTKIDKMQLPPGTNTEIHRQAFEIGTMLAGYPEVKVAVVSEDADGRELAVVQGVVTPNGDWATMLSRIEVRVQQAAGKPVADDPAPPPPTFEPNHRYSDLAALIYRAAHQLFDFELQMHVEFLKGMVAGFTDGLVGDKDTVVLIGTSLADPLGTAKAIKAFLAEMKSFMSVAKVKAVLQGLVKAAGGITFPPLNMEYLLTRASYYGGYLLGYFVEQVAVAVAIGVVTEGIGAVVSLAARAISEAVWFGKVSAKVLTFLRTVAYWFEALAEIVADTKAARAAVTLLKDSSALIELLWAKYPQATAVIKRLAQSSARVSSEVAKTALEFLTIFDRMVDAAAERVIVFVEKKGAEAARQWMSRWATSSTLKNGKRAVKVVFEVFDEAGDASESAIHLLVLTADAADGSEAATRLVVQRYAHVGQGDDLEAIAKTLKANLNDERFTDGALGQVGKILGDERVPQFTKEESRGLAMLMVEECIAR